MADLSAPKYKSAAEIEARAEEYFRGLLPDSLLSGGGHAQGGRQSEKALPPTICGLALALGFCSRQDLLVYSGKNAGLTQAVMRARLKVETFAENMLYEKETARAAEFVLRCNFGWGKPESPGTSGEGGDGGALEIIFRGFDEDKNR